MITQTIVKQLLIPLPSLTEQKRMVAKGDALLARVNAARERLARVPVILKRFRQAVLAAACLGRLTEEWRQEQEDIQDAKDLLLLILTERRKTEESSSARGRHPHQEPAIVDALEIEELPDHWTLTSGAQLFSWSSGKFLPKNKQEDGPHPVYGGNGVSGYHSEYLIDQPTLVVGRVGALCGNVYIMPGRAWVTDNAIYATYVPTNLNLQYIHMVFTQANLNADAGGSGQPFVNQTVLNAVAIPLPPLAEQHEIVRRVEVLFKLADTIEKRLAAATARAENLTRAILAKAFRGELVPTEAELARREGRDYEPAADLLARIQAERAARSGTPLVQRRLERTRADRRKPR